MSAPDDVARAIGLVIAAFGPLLVAGLLVPFRDDLASANVVLVFVLVVVFGAAVGTRWSGALSAVIAAMSYDFFFTRPYQSLKIDNANDVDFDSRVDPGRMPVGMLVPTVGLVLVGLSLTVFAGPFIGISDRAADDLRDRNVYISAVLGTVDDPVTYADGRDTPEEGGR